MNIQSVLYIGLYVLAAFGIAIGLVLSLGAGLHLETRYRRFMFPVVLPLVAVGIALATILSNRTLAVAGLDDSGVSLGLPITVPGEGGRATWPLRFVTLLILASSFALIFGSVARRRAALPGQPLFLAFAAFFITNVLLSAAFGTAPQFVLNHYYSVFVFLAAFLSREQAPEDVIRAGKFALMLLLAGSLVALFVKRSLVLQQPYTFGWIPGLRIRLWGLASHANSIGPMALLFLLLELHTPALSRLNRLMGLGVAAIVIVLAQSKTVWVIGLLLVGVLYLYRVGPQWRESWRLGRIHARLAAHLSILLLILLLAYVFILAGDPGKYWERFEQSSAGEQAFGLSGRSVIWQVAIDVWKQNPVFGYGPKLWDPVFRQSIGMNFAFHAHNQLLQSLSASGTVGVIGFFAYVLTLLYYATRLASQSAGLSLALGLFLVVRAMTETPFSTGTMFVGDFLIHALAFGYFIRMAARLPSAVHGSMYSVAARPAP